MKRCTRFLGVFLCFIFVCACIFPVSVSAADTIVINTDHASEGYFSVYCGTSDTARMKVGVTFNKKVTYYDYTPGDTSTYTFTQGNGSYTITLFRNVRGTSYKQIATKAVNVTLESSLAPYLASTKEITFSKDDAVGKKAAELCKGLTDTTAKVLAIHNFVAANLSYDYDLAANITSGTIKTYVPNTSDVLSAKKGICYDFASLFAAMCRSQEIPCAIEKGYYQNAYHAWNKVYIDGEWHNVDLTMASSHKIIKAKKLSECTIEITTDSGYRY
ncbi:MAG: transglutaminase domain-containing protein [Ruminococcaceae bacterium]|nr:transglutaminase domain-containing protein [Oscillospiraceae bacterium]